MRFEVFKRDGFKCQYCGNSAPDVVLHVDHIKPVKDGGDNNITNLITSCADCNLGKGARLLSDKSLVSKQRKQLQELSEKREQLKMMMEWREELLKLEDEKTQYLKNKFETLTNRIVTDYGVIELSKLLKKFPFEMLLDAIDASTSQYLVLKDDCVSEYTSESASKAFLYIERICRCKQNDEKFPEAKDLYYIRGILRNRIPYCDDKKAIYMLMEAYRLGVEIEDLKIIAKEVKNWTQFKERMNEIIGEDA